MAIVVQACQFPLKGIETFEHRLTKHKNTSFTGYVTMIFMSTEL